MQNLVKIGLGLRA